ncbi:MAG: 4Fe-4S binding protein [Clostridia bacterium]|nr:4Fe-4S binding protein [Clostridia bacterium]
MKKKISAFKIIKTALQLISFLLLPGLFIDSFNGIKALVQALSAGNADFAVLLPALFPSVLLVLATAIFGRFFCGYMCAFGTLGDAVHLLGNKLFKIKYRIPEKADRKLKWIKYLLLAFLVFTWITGIGVLSGWSPWDAFGSLLTLPPDFTYAFTSITVGTILLLLIVIGSLFVERFFCRYLCPMGAIFSLASLLKIAKIKKAKTNCGSCQICTSNCKMGISLNPRSVVNSGECIECMECVAACPRNNLKLSVASKDAAPLLASIAAASMIGLYYAGNLGVSAYAASLNQTVISETLSEADAATASPEISSDGTTDTQQTVSEESTAVSTPAASTSAYTDGTYTGSGTGFHGGTTTVTVTISGGQITDIQTVSTRDDNKYYTRAFSSVTSQIISSQDSSVDAVSGATFSSNGIMSAVADALTQAKE